MLITYRSILAFLDENKAITIYINKYGEQYFDIVALIFIWSVCIISLYFLIKTLRKDVLLKNNSYNLQKKPVLNKNNYFVELNPKIKLDDKKTTFIGYTSKSYSQLNQKFEEKK